MAQARGAEAWTSRSRCERRCRGGQSARGWSIAASAIGTLASPGGTGLAASPRAPGLDALRRSRQVCPAAIRRMSPLGCSD
jgi:hypothetical protein